jgi:hypothetical protein
MARTLCFDLDNTLCSTEGMDYAAAEPIPWAIERVNRLAAAGHTILIMTARGSATGTDWEPVTRAQLERWGVTFHELRFGKPPADVFIDDRAVHNTAWQVGDAFSPPPAGPGFLTSVVEAGRTWSGRTLRLDEHAERARALARGAGIRNVPSAAEIEQAVAASIPRDSGDVVYLIRISEPGGLEVACHPLSEGPQGLPADAVGSVRDGRVVLSDLSPVPSVLVAWLEELAAGAGIVVERAETAPAAAEETFLVGLPHGIAPGGSVSRSLLDAWNAAAGLPEGAPASL